MPRHFEFSDGKSEKFWEIELEGSSFTVRFGKAGAAGQTQTKTFDSEAKAKKEYDKLVAEKVGKGYVEQGDAGAAPTSAAKSSPAPAAEAKPAAPFDPDPVKNGKPAVPALLASFGAWLDKPENSLGDVEYRIEAPYWGIPEIDARLARDAFAFLHLGEGTALALLKTGPDTPAAVVMLGSEGDTETVAGSVEEFLLALAEGETGISDLDELDEESPGRRKLKAWLKKNKVTAPPAPPFDFNAWLDGKPQAPAPAKIKTEAPKATSAIPSIDQLGFAILRTEDDSAVQAWLAQLGETKVEKEGAGKSIFVRSCRVEVGVTRVADGRWLINVVSIRPPRGKAAYPGTVSAAAPAITFASLPADVRTHLGEPTGIVPPWIGLGPRYQYRREKHFVYFQFSADEKQLLDVGVEVIPSEMPPR